MKKSDLKDFMLVQWRNGDIYIILNGNLYSDQRNDEWDKLTCFNDDLTSKNYTAFDIVKVSNILSGSKLKPSYWVETTLLKNLLWERHSKETVEIGGIKYDKNEFEKVVKTLKPVE